MLGDLDVGLRGWKGGEGRGEGVECAGLARGCRLLLQLQLQPLVKRNVLFLRCPVGPQSMCLPPLSFHKAMLRQHFTAGGRIGVEKRAIQ